MLTFDGRRLLARNCHDLEKMDLEECILITDSTLTQLSIHCPKLQALSLSHCELITDDGILHLSNSTCGHERLQVLELDNCLLITDVALGHLENCRGLERLELYDCQQVTRVGIKRMWAQLPHIKVHAYFSPVTPPPPTHSHGRKWTATVQVLRHPLTVAARPSGDEGSPKTTQSPSPPLPSPRCVDFPLGKAFTGKDFCVDCRNSGDRSTFTPL
ncbi:F-box/LRR-repeat protein 2 [Tupaia chinensis]|uniref:F-box/LRR-repeat protein 2 n=1 Tax=Tupaia chinensis TaxID=246437 RepID=L9LCC5_TUPCH|nr:F-box/LRR-repeat protein 2 [Tupaia chinensis]